MIAFGYALITWLIDYLFIWWKAHLHHVTNWNIVADVINEKDLAKYSTMTFKFIRYFILIEAYKFIILTIFAPVYDMISQKVEDLLLPPKVQTSNQSWI